LADSLTAALGAFFFASFDAGLVSSVEPNHFTQPFFNIHFTCLHPRLGTSSGADWVACLVRSLYFADAISWGRERDLLIFSGYFYFVFSAFMGTALLKTFWSLLKTPNPELFACEWPRELL